PAKLISLRTQVRNRSIQLARQAEMVERIGRHQPVAGLVGRVGAEPEQLIRRRRAPPIRAFLGKRAQHRQAGQIAEDASAALAPRILEVQQLAAMLALEQFHEGMAFLQLVSTSMPTRLGPEQPDPTDNIWKRSIFPLWSFISPP